MAILISPDSADGKELARWNTPRNQMVHGLPGFKNVGYGGTAQSACIRQGVRPRPTWKSLAR